MSNTKKAETIGLSVLTLSQIKYVKEQKALLLPVVITQEITRNTRNTGSTFYIFAQSRFKGNPVAK
jgi:hypothetical protein